LKPCRFNSVKDGNMKIVHLRLMALALIATAVLFVAPSSASAAYVGIQVGTPPPPVIVERAWARPYPTAVWIPAHHEWIRGRWVWVHGYYAYPPYRGAVWISARYRNGYYYPGHWRNY
jgi:hypothetical protein